MFQRQAIEQPFGVTVYGSAILRVEPDIASIKFAVARLSQQPQDAFRDAHEGAQAVAAFMTQANLVDFGASRVTLQKSFRYTGGESKFIGYTARAAFNLILHDLDRMEEILIGLVDIGVNELAAVEFQTTRLKEIRAQVRRQAIEAAREKAENYCGAAGVRLGSVIHIEDVNPDNLQGREGRGSHSPQPDDIEIEINAFNPGSIVVGGAVIVAFDIARQE
jgi:uncharacterized protein YggE